MFPFIFSPAFSGDSHKVNKDCLLIIQCDSGHLYGDLLACARYRIDDERAKIKWRKGQGLTHVLFVIHLPRQAETHKTSFVGFQGGSWISAHIDDIRAPPESALTLDDALSSPISQLFYSKTFESAAGSEESVEERMDTEAPLEEELIEEQEAKHYDEVRPIVTCFIVIFISSLMTFHL